MAYECTPGGRPSAASVSFSKRRWRVVRVAPSPRARAASSMFWTAGYTDAPDQRVGAVASSMQATIHTGASWKWSVRYSTDHFHEAPVWIVACIERSEEHTSELQSRLHLVCRLLLEKKKTCVTQR